VCVKWYVVLEVHRKIGKVIVAIHKKGDGSEYTNYMGIYLLSLPGKVYAKCFVKRCSEKIEPTLDDTRCRFRRGRSTTDQISTLQKNFEKSWEHAKDVYRCFVDLEEAYDRLPREKRWGLLREYGVDGCLLLAVKSLYSCSEVCVRGGGVNHNCSPWVLDSDKACAVNNPLHSLY